MEIIQAKVMQKFKSWKFIKYMGVKCSQTSCQQAAPVRSGVSETQAASCGAWSLINIHFEIPQTNSWDKSHPNIENFITASELEFLALLGFRGVQKMLTGHDRSTVSVYNLLLPFLFLLKQPADRNKSEIEINNVYRKTAA